MKNKYLYIVFVFCFSFSFYVKADLKTDKILSIPLVTKIDDNYSDYITAMFKGDRNFFNGIPFQLNEKNSIIKYRVFDNVMDTVYLIIGDLNENERICIIDANKNHDFSDDYKYIYCKNAFTSKTSFPAQPINLTFNESGKKVNKIFFFKPDFVNHHNVNYTFDNAIQQKYFIRLGMSEYFTGQLKKGGNIYKIVVRPNVSLDQRSYTYVVTDSAKCCLDSLVLKNRFVYFGKRIIFNKISFKPQKIIENNSKIELEYSYVDSAKTALTGYFKGLYLPQIIEKDINGKTFNSDKLKGKYILFDFWGTWCNPCVALIPSIVKVHQTYKKLNIVSIACWEKGKSAYENVSNYIDKYQMNWINIIDSQQNKSIAIAFDVNEFPAEILVNPKGKIIYRESGSDISKLKQKLKQIYQY